MNPVYSRMAATAQRMLAKYGQATNITRTADNGGSSTLPVNVAWIGVVKHTFPGSGIAVGDDRLLLDGSVEPIRGRDTVSYAGKVGMIVEVVPINPAGLPIAYECYARAA